MDQQQHSLAEIATDARQTPEWTRYMQTIGWTIEKIDNIYMYIRPIPFFKKSLIKIQHFKGNPDFQKIDELAKKYNALSVIIEPHNIGYNQESYEKNGYILSAVKSAFTCTMLINLQQSEQELFKSFSENARRNIKKAQQNNITIKNISGEEDKDNTYIDQFYNLYKLLTDQKKFYCLPRSEIHRKFNVFRKKTFLSFAYAEDKNNPIAVVWYAYFDDTLAYFQTGITQQGYDLLANYLLVWEGFKKGQQLGLKVLDFEAIFDERYPKENRKWLGYSSFKKRFHGEIVNYPPSWLKIYNLPYKILYICSTTLFT